MWFVLKKFPANIVLFILNGIIFLSVNTCFYSLCFIDLSLNKLIGVIKYTAAYSLVGDKNKSYSYGSWKVFKFNQESNFLVLMFPFL